MLRDNKIQRKALKLGLVTGVVLLLLAWVPEQARAQWPPYSFDLTPTYDNGKITYDINFTDEADWKMGDVAIKIPLPEGTRFVEADAQPGTTVEFDGVEVTFFSASPYRDKINKAFFVVEITDSRRTVFTTRPWISWKGKQPGDYLEEEVPFDITNPPLPLDWAKPANLSLQLEAHAIVVDDTATFFIYPRNRSRRMWDVLIKVPVPEGTTLISTRPKPPFTSSFDGKEVSFSAIELKRNLEIEPLLITVSIDPDAPPTVATRVWATWKNTGRAVGRRVVAQEETSLDDVFVQTFAPQWVAYDMLGDVPLRNYDISQIGFRNTDTALEVTFYAAAVEGDISDESVQFDLLIDSDCQTKTGLWKNYRGVEYRIKYQRGKTRLYSRWDEEEELWLDSELLPTIDSSGKTVTIQIPFDSIGAAKKFCWTAQARNDSEKFEVRLPVDRVPEGKFSRLTQYDFDVVFVDEKSSSGTYIKSGDIWQYLPGWSAPGPEWESINFDASSWLSGPTSIGYGSGKHNTNLDRITYPVGSDGTRLLVQQTITQSGMVLAAPATGDENSVFMRRTFIISNSLPTQLTLDIDYEGGFIAYLNGIEVARRNLGEPGSPMPFDALAIPDGRSGNTESIDLSGYVTELVTGTNVLAVQVHSVDGTSLSVDPKLAWRFNPLDVSEVVKDADDPVTSVSASIDTPIRGKLAVPIDNGLGAYNVHVFSLPDGQELVRILNARQPNFRFDGERLLINREGGGEENVYEYNLTDWTEKQVSGAPQDWHPFYDPWGNRVVYGNSELTVGSPLPKIEDGRVVRDEDSGEIVLYSPRPPFIFVQCGLLPPHQEVEPRCRDIPVLGVLIPAGQIGEIQGTHPVWTVEETIVYRGCNTWAGSKLCGIYAVPSSSTKGFSNGYIPRQLTSDTSDTPSDTKGNLIAFTTLRDGDWEAYVMDLNGNGVRNLSNSPGSNDGLPTISPDGNWVGFVSDRGGQWAVWVVPVAGGTAQKLFDLPSDRPWAEGSRSWINERISWGP